MFRNTALALSLAAGGCVSFNEDPLDGLDEGQRTEVLSVRQDRIENAKKTVEPYIGVKAPLRCLTDKTCQWDDVEGQVHSKSARDEFSQTRLVTLDCAGGAAEFNQVSHRDMATASLYKLPRRTDLNFDVSVHQTATGMIDTNTLERAAIDDVPLALQMAKAWCPDNFGQGAVQYVDAEQRFEVSGLSLTFLAVLALATVMTTTSAINNLRQAQMREQFRPSRLITTLSHDQLSAGLFLGLVFSVGTATSTLTALMELYAAGSPYAPLANIALFHSFALTGCLAYFMERADKIFVEGTLENFPTGVTLDTLKIVAERLEAENDAGKYPRSHKNLEWMSTTKQKFMKLQHSGSLDSETMAVVTTLCSTLDNLIRRAQDKVREQRTLKAQRRGW